ASASAPRAAPAIALTPAFGPPTRPVSLGGGGFLAGETVVITFDGAGVASATATSAGAIAAKFRVPASATPGEHTVRGNGESSSSIASATFTVRTDWPSFRFDGHRTGFQRFENVLSPTTVPSMRLDWQAQLGAVVDFSSPAVVGGVAYIGSDEGVLWAYPADGCGTSLCTTPRWKSTRLWQIVDSP